MENANGHTIQLTTLYGEVVDAEDVPAAELAAALRRIHRRAVSRTNSLVVLDGVMHTRNAFLEFMREFNETDARAQLKASRVH
ncbi:MAG TPA: hypothetical protein VF522_04845 [Ramlibacter sp.]|uniref:hypothetical protein n=1 Tax=Ramlibacter sp. TaxID=1917967 RepID=UPI002ED448DD